MDAVHLFGTACDDPSAVYISKESTVGQGDSGGNLSKRNLPMFLYVELDTFEEECSGLQKSCAGVCGQLCAGADVSRLFLLSLQVSATQPAVHCSFRATLTVNIC